MNSRQENIKSPLEEYKVLLLRAKGLELDARFIKQYDDHLNVLEKIESAIKNEDHAEVSSLIDEETRYFGWSYLPNDHGEKVESAFCKVKKYLSKK